VAISLKLSRQGAVGFIDWLDVVRDKHYDDQYGGPFCTIRIIKGQNAMVAPIIISATAESPTCFFFSGGICFV